MTPDRRWFLSWNGSQLGPGRTRGPATKHPGEWVVPEAEVEPLRVAIDAALHELGVPSDETPAPVGNAVDLLRDALADR